MFTLTVLFGALIANVTSAPADEKKGDVVYLIDKFDTVVGDGVTLPNKFLPKHESDGIILSEPIPFDEELPDGIYFRPVNGKPLEPNTKLKTSPKTK